MEGCPARFGAISQLFPEQASEIKSRFWQNGYQAHARTELICPEPRRATRAPYVLDSLNRSCSRPKGMMQMHRGEFEVLDIILNKDDGDLDSGSQMSFFAAHLLFERVTPLSMMQSLSNNPFAKSLL